MASVKTRARSLPAQQRQGRRPTPQSLRTRERVIDVAARCIAAEGFAAAHTNRIAEVAGVSWGVLQYHFGDKAGLHDAILERGMAVLEREFEEVRIEGESLHGRLRAVIDAGWRIFSSDLARASNEVLVNTRGPLSDDPRHAERLDAMTRGLTRLGRRMLRRAAPEAESASIRAVEGVLFAALRGFTLALLMQPVDYDFAAERRSLVTMLAVQLETASQTPRPSPRGRTRP